MSEENNQRKHVKQRIVKPRDSADASGPKQSGGQSRPNPNRQKRSGGKKSRSGRPAGSPQDTRKRDGSGPVSPQSDGSREQRAPQGVSKSSELDRNRPKTKSNRPDRPEGARKDVKPTVGIAGDEKGLGKSKRPQRRRAKQDAPPFHAEETVEDIMRAITRLVKDIAIDIDSMRNQNLDL